MKDEYRDFLNQVSFIGNVIVGLIMGVGVVFVGFIIPLFMM